jgi:ubiquinone/menaquinone biosynthesis C-methylase UbiE
MTHDRIDEADPKNQGQLIHWAANYDRLLSVLTLGMEGRVRRRIIDAAEISPGQRVLDVGCGTGTLAIEAAKAVGPEGRVDGIDPSPEMIARATSKAKTSGRPIRFQEAGIESLPFPDDSFDSVLSSLMFHHLDGPLKISGLSEIHRVLGPGGRLTIIDFAGGGPFLHRLVAHFAHHGSDDHSHSSNAFEDLALEAAKIGFQNIASTPFKPRFLHHFSAEVASDRESNG